MPADRAVTAGSVGRTGGDGAEAAGDRTVAIYTTGFEEDDDLRSSYIRRLLILHGDQPNSTGAYSDHPTPRLLVRYWHDPRDLPADVARCLASWEVLRTQAFEFRIFDDADAAAYIRANFAEREVRAFERCRHPAMRSDFLRMCFLLREGGLYVDADDVLVGGDVDDLVADSALKLQPLCYDRQAFAMAPAEDAWRRKVPDEHRIFYVNNDPLAAAPGHPIIAKALARSTAALLAGNPRPEIQSTTGPGNLSAALAAHARELELSGGLRDFRFIRDWSATAEVCWDLSYRADARNWRNMDAG